MGVPLWFWGVLAGIVILILAGWVWAAVSVSKGGRRRLFGLLAFQVALVLCLSTWVLSGNFFGGLLVAALAPLALPFAVEEFWPFAKFILALAVWVGPVILAALAICLARPGLREWSLAIPLLFGIAVLQPVGEWLSQRAMCAAAGQLGFDKFQRNSFSWSTRNRNQEFQFEIHAFAKVDGQRLGWSYREMDWYAIPDDAWGEVKGPVFNCATDI